MSGGLHLSDVTASYGAAQALFGVSLDVARGEVVALMGRNGMGKTTTIRSICGMMPSGGTRRFAGTDLSRLPSYRIARLGIGLVPEGRRCFADLTVTENLIAAARPGPWGRAAVDRLFPRLSERAGQTARTLSGGEQQMLVIGRALMTNPRLLILDEATEGLAPLVRAEIWEAISALKSQGSISILLVDKSLVDLKAIANRAVILERGRDVWTGSMDALTPDIADAYLGI